jgi:hypothetical protein
MSNFIVTQNATATRKRSRGKSQSKRLAVFVYHQRNPAWSMLAHTLGHTNHIEQQAMLQRFLVTGYQRARQDVDQWLSDLASMNDPALPHKSIPDLSPDTARLRYYPNLHMEISGQQEVLMYYNSLTEKLDQLEWPELRGMVRQMFLRLALYYGMVAEKQANSNAAVTKS